jgi:DNA-binding XRE family transcriptional regulator
VVTDQWVETEFSGYFVNVNGDVRGRSGRVMKPQLNKKNGYLWVKIHPGHRVIYVHYLVCSTFHGPRPEGYECRHKDGNRGNNTAANLAWGTHKQNAEDMVRHGHSLKGRPWQPGRKTPKPHDPDRFPRGTDHYVYKNGGMVGNSRLTIEQAREIKIRIGENQYHLAKEFGVSRPTISNIQAGKVWKHA